MDRECKDCLHLQKQENSLSFVHRCFKHIDTSLCLRSLTDVSDYIKEILEIDFITRRSMTMFAKVNNKIYALLDFYILPRSIYINRVESLGAGIIPRSDSPLFFLCTYFKVYKHLLLTLPKEIKIYISSPWGYGLMRPFMHSIILRHILEKDKKVFIEKVTNGWINKCQRVNNKYVVADEDKMYIRDVAYVLYDDTIVEWTETFPDKVNSHKVKHAIERRLDILKESIAIRKIQRACHNWLFSPKCKDGTIGIVPRLEFKKIN